MLEKLHRLSQQTQYEQISPYLSQRKSFLTACASQIPINSAAFNGINKGMVLTCGTTLSVNEYVLERVN
jgi:hypothetical protein